MFTPKHYTEQVWDELFQNLHESIYDGVNMLKMLQKVVSKYDESLTGKRVAVQIVKKGDFQNVDGNKVWVPRKVSDFDFETIQVTLPSFRDVFLHDMLRFLAKWKDIESQALNEILPVQFGGSPLLLDKVLRFTDEDFNKYFSGLMECTEHLEENEQEDFWSWVRCVVKGVVETTRRIAGLDVNGRYKKAFVVYTAIAMASPGEPVDIKPRFQLVSEDTAMEYLEKSKELVPSEFKTLA